ncbi:DUF418 domain-containing protein [Kribbella sp. NPDC058245]|uniref:DUF418 domain-containing protein n=1 Tax=Kribbella sp. NPDC058245 TaxID=3346399 RepID=UPI0036E73360
MTTTGGPTEVAERALGPDLARGVMLAFIALANSHYFVAGTQGFAGFPTGASGVDRAVGMVISTFVDGRAFPMFGLLFGYGVAQIVRRQREAGREWWPIRKLLWRRSLVLVVLGFVHCMLLYVGDILAAYGVLLFLGVWAIRWKTGWLFGVAAFVLVLTALPTDTSLMDGTDPSMLPHNLLDQFADRIVVQPFIALLGPIGFMTPFLIGLWAGRRRVLERPAEHLILLRTTVAVGLPIAIIGALPVSLVVGGIIAVPSDHVLNLIGPIHDATGAFGGFGYAALIVLIAHRITAGRITTGRVTQAIAAVGQRSLTCYLSQSVVWAIVFTPYLLDLSGTLTTATTALLAIATWLATVLMADRMRKANYRGPFEKLIRWFTYRTAATRSRNSGSLA